MKFFIDNNLPPNWARGLKEISNKQFPHDQVNEVIHLSDKFSLNTPDLDWLKTLGQEKDWVIISGDNFRKRDGAERKIIQSFGLSVFVLQKSWSWQKYWDKTTQLVRWWPKIVSQANSAQRLTFEVPWRPTSKFKQI